MSDLGFKDSQQTEGMENSDSYISGSVPQYWIWEYHLKGRDIFSIRIDRCRPALLWPRHFWSAEQFINHVCRSQVTL